MELITSYIIPESALRDKLDLTFEIILSQTNFALPEDKTSNSWCSSCSANFEGCVGNSVTPEFKKFWVFPANPGVKTNFTS